MARQNPLKKSYVIQAAGLAGDFGSFTLICSELGHVLETCSRNDNDNRHDIIKTLPEWILLELGQEVNSEKMGDDLIEDIISDIEICFGDAQDMDCFISNIEYQKPLTCAKTFTNLISLFLYVKEQKIELIEHIY